MKRKITINEDTDTKIKEISNEFKKVGLSEFSKYYFVDEMHDGPFFEIVLREGSAEGEETILFIVSNEYLICTKMGCEKYDDINNALEDLLWLCNGGLQEVFNCAFNR